MTRSDFAARPLFALLLERTNLLIVGMGMAFVLLTRSFAVLPLLLLLDVVAAAGYLLVPSRRAAVLRRFRHKRREAAAARLRCTDRLHWIELEDAVRATRLSLPEPRIAELERLLELYVEVGAHAARWELQIERFGRLPTTTPPGPIGALTLARGERRASAARALESLTTQLATVSTLIQLGCEEAVAARVAAAAGHIGAHVDEARRAAQLAIEAGDEVNAVWDPIG